MEFFYDVVVIGAGHAGGSSSFSQYGFEDVPYHDGHEQDWADELQSCHWWYCQGADSTRD